MIVKSLDDMRKALEQMAARNKVSITTLNELAKVGQGCLTRFMRGEIRVRKGNILTDAKTITDLRLATILKVVEAADFELVIRPKVTTTRREQVRAAVRQKGSVDDAAA